MTESSAPADRLVVGRRRVILMTAGVAALSLATGVLLAGRITSPQEAAARARPPDAGVITAPVERRVVSNEIVTRGDVVYEGAVDVTVSTAGLATSPVVTGQVPRVGDSLEAGQVALQVVGRPVLALTGSVPTYRTLSPGLSGPDVLQLKTALAALGLDPGDPANDRYDERTSAAVAELYARVGYTAPAADEALLDELDAARETLAGSEESVIAAEQELASASAPLPESEQLAAEAEVAAAHRALSEAQASGDPVALADAQTQLAIAEAQRDELLAPPDTTAAQAAVSQARARMTEALAKVTDLASRTGTPLPAAEVVFLPTLPRRIDAVHVAAGRTIDGPVLRVSGTEVVVVASLGSVDARLVGVDRPATIDVGDEDVAGTVLQVRDVVQPEARDGEEEPPEANAGKEAVIRPATLSPEQVDRLRGQNVRVTIPVRSTEGEVLAAPLAALSAGPGGEARVEVRRADGEVVRLEVEVGLSAGGFAEVRPVGGSLVEGDHVVVGR